mmetsp:Transcript_27319/g.55773  ORF Transcript_27319/g.55773 Transcript_27319/m.55773 type:complete len:243 (+) Transcript_27319:46-774(+)
MNFCPGKTTSQHHQIFLCMNPCQCTRLVLHPRSPNMHSRGCTQSMLGPKFQEKRRATELAATRKPLPPSKRAHRNIDPAKLIPRQSPERKLHLQERIRKFPSYRNNWSSKLDLRLRKWYMTGRFQMLWLCNCNDRFHIDRPHILLSNSALCSVCNRLKKLGDKPPELERVLVSSFFSSFSFSSSFSCRRRHLRLLRRRCRQRRCRHCRRRILGRRRPLFRRPFSRLQRRSWLKEVERVSSRK